MARATGGGSMLRVSAYADPIAIVGIALSIVVSLVLDLTNAATGVESFLACLMGITIALVVDANARAERRFRMRNMIEAAPWLGLVLGPLVEFATEIERRYPGTPVGAEARLRFERLHDDLDDLRRGRIARGRYDFEHLLASTRGCRHTLRAVTNVMPEAARGLEWWTSDIGRQYWEVNLAALARGVRIERIFAYTELTAELRDLVAVQRRAGVRVGLAPARGLDPALRFNLAIWDDTSAWEARLNAGGEIAGNVFTINDRDLGRLGEAFRLCGMAADFSTDSATGSPAIDSPATDSPADGRGVAAS
jgi:hypothetical protein